MSSDDEEYVFEVEDSYTMSREVSSFGAANHKEAAHPYVSLTPQELYTYVYNLAKDLAPLTCLSVPSLVQILMTCRLEPESVKISLFGDDDARKTALTKKHHICVDAREKKSEGLGTNAEEVDCGICCNEVAPGEGFTTCGDHFLCLECMSDFLKVVVQSWEPRYVVLQCLIDHVHCHKAVDFLEAIQTVAPTRIKSLNVNSFRLLFLSRFAGQIADSLSAKDAQSKVILCTEMGCPSIFKIKTAEAKAKNILTGQCDGCASSTCFECHEVGHQPVTCDDMKSWLIKEKDDGETGNWLLTNTKPCPGCNNPIEKNGGCNRILCSKCNYEFCWMCMEKWSVHGYTYECNKVKQLDPKEAASKSAAERNLIHYIHYYERYNNHRISRALDKKTIQSVRAFIDTTAHVDTSGGVGMEYLADAASTLAEARHVLSITYVYAYYNDDKSINLPLFEYNQGQLEFATEQLSSIVEKKENLTMARKDVNNRTGLATHWLSVLQQGDYSCPGSSK